MFSYLSLALFIVQTPAAVKQGARVPTLTRLTVEHLSKVREDVEALAKLRKTVANNSKLIDLRCILHAHSYLSHDSRGTIQEIAAAAKLNKIDAVLLSNHPKKDEDVVTVGQTGEVDGVLFVSGSETNGFLVYPGNGKLPPLNVSEQELVSSVQASGGMIFIAHPEEHKDWNLKGLTGTEIYNTHADVKDESDLMSALQPKEAKGFQKLIALLGVMDRYPQEAFAAMFDAPNENLSHFDQIAANRPVAAIAGNDSHQNTGFVVVGADGGKFIIQSPIGEKLAEVDTVKTPAAKFLFGEPVAGKEARKWILDKYPISMHYVSTHVLASNRSAKSIQSALESGRTYVGFDWLADPSGFTFAINSSGVNSVLGDSVKLVPGTDAHVETPLPGHIKLLCDGKVVASVDGYKLTHNLTTNGLYRVEVTLSIGGEPLGWIYSGGIRVK